MKNTVYAALLFLGLVILAISPASANDSPLILGVFPRHNAEDTMRMFTPLAEHLSKQLGRKVRLETSKDFPSFWKGVAEQRYDIVHFNQLQYVKSHAKHGYDVILMNEENGATTMSGMIVVRKGSGLQKLQDLRGKKINFGGDRTAMMSYVLPTKLLRNAGLQKGDYEEEFAKNPPNAFLAVYFRQADAAGIGDTAFRDAAATKGIDVSQMTILGRTASIAQLPWAVTTRMPAALRQKIQSVLLDLKFNTEGQEILRQAHLTGLVTAADKDYDAVRNIAREFLGESY